eukprot:58775-Pleurochrysis_carterae.AAC.1
MYEKEKTEAPTLKMLLIHESGEGAIEAERRVKVPRVTRRGWRDGNLRVLLLIIQRRACCATSSEPHLRPTPKR